MAGGTSYNGWPCSDDPNAIDIQPFGDAYGAPFPGGVRGGDVATVLGYVCTQLHYRVEPVVSGWCWGYSYRANVNNPSSLSCHASGTAVDWNAVTHPNGGSAYGGFDSAQVAEIRAILAEVQGSVQWGADYSGTKDPMHFEIIVNATTLAAVAASLPGGGSAPVPTPDPEDEDMAYQLIKADSGNGAIFAYAPGRFIHVADPAHLDVGHAAGLWDSGQVAVVSAGDLDVLRDNSCGNATDDTPDAKGVNLTSRLPSAVAGA